MRQFYVFLWAVLFVNPVSAQRYPFQRINVTDSIAVVLNKEYGRTDVGAGYNVFKMAIMDDFEFDSGLYVYKGVGPHFPVRMFIFNDDSLYVFKTLRHDVREYMMEWRSYLIKASMEDERIINYTVQILHYLYDVSGMDSVAFADSLSSYIEMIPVHKGSENLLSQIYSRYENYNYYLLSLERDYHDIGVDIGKLYGKWYFQTIIHKEYKEDGEELTQQSCGNIPYLYLNPNGEGIYYENGKRNIFHWSCNDSILRLHGIGKPFFSKRNPMLRVRNMFTHNNKIFIELGHGRDCIYVLSRQSRYAD